MSGQQKVSSCMQCSLQVAACSNKRDRIPHRTHSLEATGCNQRPIVLQASIFWCAVLLLMCCIVPSTVAQTGNILTTEPATTTTSNNISATLPENKLNLKECFGSMDTIAQGVYICEENPDLYQVLKNAEEDGLRECQTSFKDEIWNCSSFSILHEPEFSRIAQDVYKVSAYLYALSLAAIAHSVSSACENSPSLCGCQGGGESCPIAEHSMMVAETFLNKRYEGRSLKIELIHLNFAVAKEHILDLMNNTSSSECKCHGISGSCSFRICFTIFPNLNIIAKTLKEAYYQACKIVPSGHSNTEWVTHCGRPTTKKDLLYSNAFNWCQYRPEVGSLGTEGRECDPHADASDPRHCNNLCHSCGLRVLEVPITEAKPCDCSFTYCCSLNCADCIKERTFYVCTRST